MLYFVWWMLVNYLDIEQRNEHGQTYEDENNETSERDCLVYRPLDNNSGKNGENNYNSLRL